jgi:hypothetical protein
MPPKQGLPPPPRARDEEDECVGSKELRTMMKSMTELFMKNQQSTDITLERVERSIAKIIDRVDALETGLPPVDQVKLAEETREDDYNEVEEEEEPFNPPPPPQQRQHRDDQQGHQEHPRPPCQSNWQGMGGHPHRGPNQYHLAVMMILLLTLSLLLLPFMVCMMLKLI